MSTATAIPKTRIRPIEILLVEDDDEDVLLMEHALKKDRILNRLNRVEDGVEAIKYLRRQAEYADAMRPDLILLDLNMPRKDGRETLREIKQDPELQSIPVVILTTSEDQADIQQSYHDHVNSYVSKPVDLDQFRGIVSVLQEYWFCIVQLPHESKSDS